MAGWSTRDIAQQLWKIAIKYAYFGGQATEPIKCCGEAYTLFAAWRQGRWVLTDKNARRLQDTSTVKLDTIFNTEECRTKSLLRVIYKNQASRSWRKMVAN